MNGKTPLFTYNAGDPILKVEFKSFLRQVEDCPLMLNGTNVTITSSGNSNNLIYEMTENMSGTIQFNASKGIKDQNITFSCDYYDTKDKSIKAKGFKVLIVVKESATDQFNSTTTKTKEVN